MQVAFKSKNVEVLGQKISISTACWCLLKCWVKHSAPLCPRVTQEEPCITLINPLFHLAAVCAGV